MRSDVDVNNLRFLGINNKAGLFGIAAETVGFELFVYRWRWLDEVIEKLTAKSRFSR